jgi:hypothetical protein
MKKKKSTTEKADQFLSGLGTAGGDIGSPQLVGFGGTDLQSQVMSGNAAEATQNMIMSEEQMFLAQYLPAAGLSQLPVGQPPLESGKGEK